MIKVNPIKTNLNLASVDAKAERGGSYYGNSGELRSQSRHYVELGEIERFDIEQFDNLGLRLKRKQ